MDLKILNSYQIFSKWFKSKHEHNERFFLCLTEESSLRLKIRFPRHHKPSTHSG